MWRKFLGDKARIIGIDLNPDAKKWESFGFEIHIGDQSLPVFWDSFYAEVGRVDVVLDDGGHTYLQQITTLNKSMEFISDQGLIIIEDTHTSFLGGFGPRKHSFINYVFELVRNKNSKRSFSEETRHLERVGSIQFFDSITVIRPPFSGLNRPHSVVGNLGTSDDARDYRHENVPAVVIFRKLLATLRRLRFPGVSVLEHFLLSSIKSLQWSNKPLRKYFQSLR